jgi:hypothetical protein
VYVLVVILALYVGGCWFSPFPYWTTYRVLWRKVLFDPTPEIGVAARLRQAKFLIQHLLLAPLGTGLWYLDDIFFPEYRSMQVRPLFVIGGPRSGTTLLHRTLGADTERFFAVRHIEWRYPYIIVQRLIEATGLADRLQHRSYWPDTEAGRAAQQMHPDNLYDFEEDAIFYEERFLHHLFLFLRFPYPGLLTYLDDYPALPELIQRRMLMAHRKVIQKVMYLRGNSSLQFLSKEVASNNKIPALIELYPDARFVLIIRPAEEFMGSLMALVRKSTAVKTGVDPIDIPGWQEAFIERMGENSALLADLCEQRIAPDRQVRTTFAEFTADIPAGVRSVYRRLGETPSDAYLGHLEGIAVEQRGRTRGYSYTAMGAGKGFSRFNQFAATVAMREGLVPMPAASETTELNSVP